MSDKGTTQPDASSKSHSGHYVGSGGSACVHFQAGEPI